MITLMMLVSYTASVQSYHQLRHLTNEKEIEARNEFLERQRRKKEHQAFEKIAERRKLYPRLNQSKAPVKGIEIPASKGKVPHMTPMLQKMIYRHKQALLGTPKRHLTQQELKTAHKTILTSSHLLGGLKHFQVFTNTSNRQLI